MENAGSAGIPCVVQAGHHYAAPIAQYLGAIDRCSASLKIRTSATSRNQLSL